MKGCRTDGDSPSSMIVGYVLKEKSCEKRMLPQNDQVKDDEGVNLAQQPEVGDAYSGSSAT